MRLGLLSDFKTLLLLLILSLVLIFIDNLKFLELPKSLAQVVTSPIQYGLYKSSLAFGKQFEFIVLARRASQQNKAMTEQMAQILSENAQLRKKVAELQGFVEQEKSLNPQTFTLEAARPIGMTRYLLLDKGSDDGLKLEQTVVYKDHFIGVIKEISPKKAQVLLSTDPDSHIAGFSNSDKGKAKGVLNGQYGAEMLLDKILHEEPIEKDNLIYSEGSEVSIPRGLILGQVVEVISKDNEVFKQAKIKPVFRIADLDVVFVITN